MHYYTTEQTTALITFLLFLQTIIIAQDREGQAVDRHTQTDVQRSRQTDRQTEKREKANS